MSERFMTEEEIDACYDYVVLYGLPSEAAMAHVRLIALRDSALVTLKCLAYARGEMEVYRQLLQDLIRRGGSLYGCSTELAKYMGSHPNEHTPKDLDDMLNDVQRVLKETER